MTRLWGEKTPQACLQWKDCVAHFWEIQLAWMGSIRSMEWSLYLSAKMYLTEINMSCEIPFISVQSVKQDFYHGYQPWSHGPSHLSMLVLWLKLAQRTWRDLNLQSFCWLCRKQNLPVHGWSIYVNLIPEGVLSKKTSRHPIHAGIAIVYFRIRAVTNLLHPCVVRWAAIWWAPQCWSFQHLQK